MDQSVLLVDDDPAILKSVGSFLERSGYEVFRAATGELALAQNEKNAPDVVLLDLHLPEMSGFEVLETLREQDAAVIVLTGRSDIETAVQAMQRGAENFLTKPVDMPHLLLAVDRVRDKVRMRRDVGLLMARANPETDTSSLGSSPKMREIARQVELLASNDDTTTLIIGESGTGKGYFSLGCVRVPGSHSKATSSALSQGNNFFIRFVIEISCCTERYEGVPPPK